MNSIREIIAAEWDSYAKARQMADCVILTQNRKILLQERPANWETMPGVLSLFGGHVEKGETIMEALVRELEEELGARIEKKDAMFLGAVTEDITGHSELIHVYFWHDRDGTITGCFEALPKYFDDVEQALSHPEMMDYAKWALSRCKIRGLLPF